MRTNIFDRLSFLSLFLVTILLPLFCLPFSNISIEVSKGLLLVIGLTLAIIFWSIARFIDGKIILPKSWLLVSGFGIVLVFLISALFSSSSNVSLFGSMLDIGSFWFIFASFVLMFMFSLIFRTPKRAKVLLLGAILSSTFVLIFQVFYIFFPSALSLGVLVGKTANILGSWNSLGLFAGFSGLMFLLVSEFFPISKVWKIILEVLIILSIFLTACVNFPLAWVLVGISSLIIFVYKVSLTLGKGEDERRHFPLASFIVMIVSMLFFISSGTVIGSYIPIHFNLTNQEVAPTFTATASIAKNVLKAHPILGIGPNRFGEAWSMYKPASVNTTPYFSYYFDSGSGLLPTLLSTTGALGIIAWVIFLLLFLVAGVRYIFKNGVNWEMMAFFVLSLYLFISAFFYPVGTVLFLLAMIFTGVFIGLAVSDSGKELSISFSHSRKRGFFSILFLVLLVMSSVVLSFNYMERFVAVYYFGKTSSASDFTSAENYIYKAISLYPNDLYLRTYSQVYLLDSNSIASKGSALTKDEQATLRNKITQAVNGALSAKAYDPQNYLNFQMLGSVYQESGDYPNAIASFEEASKLNPIDPSIKLAIAQASLYNKNTQDALKYANQALSLKPDYSSAFFTLSLIATSEGDNAKALSYANSALEFDPTNTDLAKYVNSLSSSSTSTSTTPPASSKTVPEKTKK